MTTIADVANNFMGNMRGISPTMGAARGYKAGVQLGQKDRSLALQEQQLAQQKQQSEKTNQLNDKKLSMAKDELAYKKRQEMAKLSEEERAQAMRQNFGMGMAIMGAKDPDTALIALQKAGKIDPNITVDDLPAFLGQNDVDGKMAGFAQFQQKQRETARHNQAMEQNKGPLVEVNTGTAEPPYKIPTGFMLKDPSNPSLGVTPIPGGPKDQQTPEQAGKTQMMRTAQKQYKNVYNLVFDKDGSPNWTNITNAWANTPKTKGRDLATAIEYGIQAITRAETGAAMPESEVDNTRKRFQPVPGDTPRAVKIKMDMFNDFINGTLKLIDPSGRFNDERFQKEFESRENPDSPRVESTGMGGIHFLGFE